MTTTRTHAVPTPIPSTIAMTSWAMDKEPQNHPRPALPPRGGRRKSTTGAEGVHPSRDCLVHTRFFFTFWGRWMICCSLVLVWLTTGLPVIQDTRAAWRWEREKGFSVEEDRGEMKSSGVSSWLPSHVTANIEPKDPATCKRRTMRSREEDVAVTSPGCLFSSFLPLAPPPLVPPPGSTSRFSFPFSFFTPSSSSPWTFFALASAEEVHDAAPVDGWKVVETAVQEENDPSVVTSAPKEEEGAPGEEVAAEEVGAEKEISTAKASPPPPPPSFSPPPPMEMEEEKQEDVRVASESEEPPPDHEEVEEKEESDEGSITITAAPSSSVPPSSPSSPSSVSASSSFAVGNDTEDYSMTPSFPLPSGKEETMEREKGIRKEEEDPQGVAPLAPPSPVSSAVSAAAAASLSFLLVTPPGVPQEEEEVERKPFKNLIYEHPDERNGGEESQYGFNFHSYPLSITEEHRRRYLHHYARGEAFAPASSKELDHLWHRALYALYIKENMTQMIERIMEASALGSRKAQWVLGGLHAHGIGVERNEVLAILHYRFAALPSSSEFSHHPLSSSSSMPTFMEDPEEKDGPFLPAHLTLASRYASGEGVVQDCSAAVHHLQIVADSIAQRYLPPLSVFPPPPEATPEWTRAMMERRKWRKKEREKDEDDDEEKADDAEESDPQKREGGGHTRTSSIETVSSPFPVRRTRYDIFSVLLEEVSPSPSMQGTLFGASSSPAASAAMRRRLRELYQAPSPEEDGVSPSHGSRTCGPRQTGGIKEEEEGSTVPNEGSDSVVAPFSFFSSLLGFLRHAVQRMGSPTMRFLKKLIQGWWTFLSPYFLPASMVPSVEPRTIHPTKHDDVTTATTMGLHPSPPDWHPFFMPDEAERVERATQDAAWKETAYFGMGHGLSTKLVEYGMHHLRASVAETAAVGRMPSSVWPTRRRRAYSSSSLRPPASSSGRGRSMEEPQEKGGPKPECEKPEEFTHWQIAKKYFLLALERKASGANSALGMLYALGDPAAAATGAEGRRYTTPTTTAEVGVEESSEYDWMFATPPPPPPPPHLNYRTAFTYFQEGWKRKELKSANGLGFLHALGVVHGDKWVGATSTATARTRRRGDRRKAETSVRSSSPSLSTFSSPDMISSLSLPPLYGDAGTFPVATPDYVTAVKYFTIAANSRVMEGLYNLAVCQLLQLGTSSGDGQHGSVQALTQFLNVAQLTGNPITLWQISNLLQQQLRFTHDIIFSSLGTESQDTHRGRAALRRHSPLKGALARSFMDTYPFFTSPGAGGLHGNTSFVKHWQEKEGFSSSPEEMKGWGATEEGPSFEWYRTFPFAVRHCWSVWKVLEIMVSNSWDHVRFPFYVDVEDLFVTEGTRHAQRIQEQWRSHHSTPSSVSSSGSNETGRRVEKEGEEQKEASQAGHSTRSGQGRETLSSHRSHHVAPTPSPAPSPAPSSSSSSSRRSEGTPSMSSAVMERPVVHPPALQESYLFHWADTLMDQERSRRKEKKRKRRGGWWVEEGSEVHRRRESIGMDAKEEVVEMEKKTERRLSRPDSGSTSSSSFDRGHGFSNAVAGRYRRLPIYLRTVWQRDRLAPSLFPSKEERDMEEEDDLASPDRIRWYIATRQPPLPFTRLPLTTRWERQQWKQQQEELAIEKQVPSSPSRTWWRWWPWSGWWKQETPRRKEMGTLEEEEGLAASSSAAVAASWMRSQVPRDGPLEEEEMVWLPHDTRAREGGAPDAETDKTDASDAFSSSTDRHRVRRGRKRAAPSAPDHSTDTFLSSFMVTLFQVEMGYGPGVGALTDFAFNRDVPQTKEDETEWRGSCSNEDRASTASTAPREHHDPHSPAPLTVVSKGPPARLSAAQEENTRWEGSPPPSSGGATTLSSSSRTRITIEGPREEEEAGYTAVPCERVYSKGFLPIHEDTCLAARHYRPRTSAFHTSSSSSSCPATTTTPLSHSPAFATSSEKTNKGPEETENNTWCRTSSPPRPRSRFSTVYERTEEDLKALRRIVRARRRPTRVLHQEEQGRREGGEAEEATTPSPVQDRFGFLFLWPYLTAQPLFSSIADERDYGIFYEGEDGGGERCPERMEKGTGMRRVSEGSVSFGAEESQMSSSSALIALSPYSSIRAAYAHPRSASTTTRSTFLRASSMFLPPPPPSSSSSSSLSSMLVPSTIVRATFTGPLSSFTPPPPPPPPPFLQRWMSQEEAVEHWRYRLLSRSFFFRTNDILYLRHAYMTDALQNTKLFHTVVGRLTSKEFPGWRVLHAPLTSDGHSPTDYNTLSPFEKRREMEKRKRWFEMAQRTAYRSILEEFMERYLPYTSLAFFIPLESVALRLAAFHYDGPSLLLGRSIPRSMHTYLDMVKRARAWNLPPSPRALFAAGSMHQLGLATVAGYNARLLFLLRHPEKTMPEEPWATITDKEEERRGKEKGKMGWRQALLETYPERNLSFPASSPWELEVAASAGYFMSPHHPHRHHYYRYTDAVSPSPSLSSRSETTSRTTFEDGPSGLPTVPVEGVGRETTGGAWDRVSLASTKSSVTTTKEDDDGGVGSVLRYRRRLPSWAVQWSVDRNDFARMWERRARDAQRGGDDDDDDDAGHGGNDHQHDGTPAHATSMKPPQDPKRPFPKEEEKAREGAISSSQGALTSSPSSTARKTSLCSFSFPFVSSLCSFLQERGWWGGELPFRVGARIVSWMRPVSYKLYPVEEVVDPFAQEAFQNMWNWKQQAYFLVDSFASSSSTPSTVGGAPADDVHGPSWMDPEKEYVREPEEDEAKKKETPEGLHLWSRQASPPGREKRRERDGKKGMLEEPSLSPLKWYDVYELPLAKELYDESIQAAASRKEWFHTVGRRIDRASVVSRCIHYVQEWWEYMVSSSNLVTSTQPAAVEVSPTASFSSMSSKKSVSAWLSHMLQEGNGKQAATLARASLNWQWWWLHFSEKCDGWWGAAKRKAMKSLPKGYFFEKLHPKHAVCQQIDDEDSEERREALRREALEEAEDLRRLWEEERKWLRKHRRDGAVGDERKGIVGLTREEEEAKAIVVTQQELELDEYAQEEGNVTGRKDSNSTESLLHRLRKRGAPDGATRIVVLKTRRDSLPANKARRWTRWRAMWDRMKYTLAFTGLTLVVMWKCIKWMILARRGIRVG